MQILSYFSGASGSLSTTYFPLAQEIIGTPGTFLTLRFRSRSLVAVRRLEVNSFGRDLEFSRDQAELFLKYSRIGRKVRTDDIDLALHYSINDAIIGIYPLVL
jgi:hypothetical protein